MRARRLRWPVALYCTSICVHVFAGTVLFPVKISVLLEPLKGKNRSAWLLPL